MNGIGLSDLIHYAYDHVSYYKKIFDDNNIDVTSIKAPEDLKNLPVLTKDVIQENSMMFVSDEYQKYPKNENIVLKRTSGSTGKFLKIFWDYKDDIKSLMPLWILRSRLYGIDPDMKWCSFYSSRYEGNKIKQLIPRELDMNGRHMGFSKIGLTYDRIAEIYKDIISFNPDWMLLQPSIAYLMAQIVKQYNMKIPTNLKHIELSGEYLFDSYRKQINEVFGIDPVNQYGCNEANEIAYECKCHNMHVIENNVIVEVLKDGIPVFILPL